MEHLSCFWFGGDLDLSGCAVYETIRINLAVFIWGIFFKDCQVMFRTNFGSV